MHGARTRTRVSLSLSPSCPFPLPRPVRARGCAHHRTCDSLKLADSEVQPTLSLSLFLPIRPHPLSAYLSFSAVIISGIRAFIGSESPLAARPHVCRAKSPALRLRSRLRPPLHACPASFEDRDRGGWPRRVINLWRIAVDGICAGKRGRGDHAVRWKLYFPTLITEKVVLVLF